MFYFTLPSSFVISLQLVMEYCGAGSVTDLVKVYQNTFTKGGLDCVHLQRGSQGKSLSLLSVTLKRPSFAGVKSLAQEQGDSS